MSLDICPRCHKYIEGYPAMSRTDNRTDVCSKCGVNEGLQAMVGALTPQAEWPVSMDKVELGLKIAQDGSTSLVLIIPTEEEDPQNYRRLQEAIGGELLQAVRIAGDLCVMCDEEGKIMHRDVNIRATQLASAVMRQTMGVSLSPDVLVGDVVFLGWDGSPVTSGLSDEWIAGFKRQGLWPIR
jgi:hypothetical protein